MKIKWGVIGCGGIADRRTIPGMMLAENAELVAVMDVNKAVAERTAQKYGAKYAFDNADELLKTDEIQAVYIASPVFCHSEQCIAAAKAKKHILIEKPVALTAEEAQKLSDICDKEGVKLSVGFMMRFHAYHQKMRELISEGKLGEIVSARAQLTCWYPEMDNCWRQNKELSGGVICDGLGSSFAACFGVLPNTSFSQNVGLVAMTKVVNRGALATGAIFLILCGLIPKLGALVSIMPQAVLGGAAVMMFSSIVVSGIQLITKEKMTPRTLTIVSVALGVGYGMGANASILAHTPQLFQLICGESGIVPAAFVAIVLNVLLPKDEENA